MPAEPTSLPDLVRSAARRAPDAPFLTWRDRTTTFGEFDQRTDALAAGLLDLGVTPGDVVSVLLPNRPEFLEAWWAILKAGAVFSPVNPAFTASEATYVLEHAEAVAVVTDAHGAARIAAARDDLPDLRTVITVDAGEDVRLADIARPGAALPPCPRGRADLAAVLYTSGTTGRPKGAMLTHGNVLANAAMTAELVPLAPGDRVGMILPLFHANAQVLTCVVPLMIGCHVTMWDGFSASDFWAAVERFRPVALSVVPTILAAVSRTPGVPPGQTSLRYVVCGAAPLSPELLEAFQDRFGIRVLEGYGLTEATCVSSLNPFHGERRPGSIGMPVRGQEMRIAGEDGVEAATGQYGEIVVKGPNVMAGYLKDAEATAEAIRDGWLHTGDIGYVDADGYFFIVDRSKDVIIRGGENVYPREVEAALEEHPGVREAAVIGIPDEVRGEEVLAIVVPKPGCSVDAGELAVWASERLARFKVPCRFEFREELPRTSTGKLSKPPLREEFGHWAPAGAGG